MPSARRFGTPITILPVLLLSARTLAEDRAPRLRGGGQSVPDQTVRSGRVVKPHQEPAEARVVTSRIESRETQLPRTSYRFGNAVVDFDTFEVTVNDRPVRLTKLELELLKYFVNNEQRVVSRQELLEEVWKMPPHISTRAPDQFIRRLRKIFETDPVSAPPFSNGPGRRLPLCLGPRRPLTVRDRGGGYVSRMRSIARSLGRRTFQASPQACMLRMMIQLESNCHHFRPCRADDGKA